MSREEYIRLMKFPVEWEEWNMIPQEWLQGAIDSYQPGMEQASEHDRHGAIQWWLRKCEPTTTDLVQLAKLTLLDPDSIMAESARKSIRDHKGYCDEVKAVIENAT